MTTKLTLTINGKVLSSAKRYAKQMGERLSALVENYLLILSTDGIEEDAISPRILKLMGSLQLPKDYNYDEALTKALMKKFKS